MFHAILPMRKGSKRVPGKNTRLLNGFPLYTYILRELQSLREIEQVIISSDDSQLIEKLGSLPKVRALLRPDNLAQDSTSMNEVIQHCLQRTDGDLFIQVHATSPLLTAQTIRRALDVFTEAGLRTGNSLLAVTALEERLWTSEGEPVNHDPNRLLPSQETKKIYADCSAFYIFTRSEFEVTQSRVHGRPIFFPISPVEAWDIDYEWQWNVAGYLKRTQIV